MKNISKLFGAVAIVGLFLLGSASAGLAAQGQTQQQQIPPQQQDNVEVSWTETTYPLDQYGYPGETSNYPITQAMLGDDSGHILVARAWRVRGLLPNQEGHLKLYVRNIANSKSTGGQINTRLWVMVGGSPGDLRYNGEEQCGDVIAHTRRVVYCPGLLEGTILLNAPLFVYRAEILPYGPQIFHIARWGVVVGLLDA